MQEYREKREEIEQRVAEISRVARVTAGGRRFGFRILVIAGNRKGKVGMGIGKANDISDAIAKAGRQAVKHMTELPLRNGTIPFEIQAKFKMAKIILKPISKGRGIIAGGVIRGICELAGVENINAKVLSASKSKINNARAIFLAFEKIKELLNVKTRPSYAASSDKATS